nr:bifunctional DNA-formamidopyrimidine glycosylase/DNA-(apurinic or apyrimidinic site) lyase [Arsenicicoccus piscis]
MPEVEVVRRGLADHVVGRRIAAAEVTGNRVARRHLPGPLDLAHRLAGQQVRAAERRGKYLWLVLDGEALVIHLGMSGQLLVEPADSPRERHLHATLDFADDGPQLRFVDQRTFGGLALTDLVLGRGGREVPQPVAHIAPDPLETVYDQAGVVRALKAKNTEIKRALLDQGLVSGIGNIYADEALWRAGVHGRRITSTLTKPTLARVLDQAAEVMREALGQGGTSFDALYVNVNGASGRMTLNVYGREGRPCKRCGTPIMRERFMNRSSHFCPTCQRKR